MTNPSRATIDVASASPYRVTIGGGLTADVLAAVGDAPAAALLHPAALRGDAADLADALGAAGVPVTRVELPDAEDAKTLAVLGECWRRFGEAGLDRTSVVIGFGGGTVTDLAGFAAATWMRGVKVVQVPTTLLAMVDAAVGGKTGINTDAGKNMVGSFHEPAAVVADLSRLATLPREDVIAGMGEIIKTGFIADEEILQIVERDPDAAMDPSSPQLAELVRRSVAVKARVVAADLTESHLREILNYGHTLAHAIEKREHYRWRHGSAVAVGCVFVAELARAAGRLGDSAADRHRQVLELVGLPTSYQSDAFDELLDLMYSDKKVRRGVLRFVVLDAIGHPGWLEGPDRALLAQAYQAMGAA